ncbi:hypothetical protein [Paenibacillus albidus]|uniref:hypothetical protein n=1 Tax=Paenibacillus albidus TaxID=2041023 RepID=UPI00166F60AE|nr:hypothetical protein [Paenibacillus albidus]
MSSGYKSQGEEQDTGGTLEDVGKEALEAFILSNRPVYNDTGVGTAEIESMLLALGNK